MKKVLNDIFNILNTGEKNKLWRLSVADVLINVLDVAFLVGLLYVINFYTQPNHTIPSGFMAGEIFNEHPLLLIFVFFLLFTVKNICGFIVSKWQYHFVYGVASRISRDNLMQYLDGTYADFVHIDSSVINRKISQQPIEFSHYLLNGIQQAFSQTVLITITCLMIILFNPLLFPLLICILVPPIILISYLMKRKLNATRRHGKSTSEKAIQHLQEALSGYVESNIYLKNDFFTNRYHRFQEQLNRYLSERLIIQNMPTRLMEVFAVFGLLILVCVNALVSHNYSVRVVTIGALMVAAYKIIPGIVKISNILGQIKSYEYASAGLTKTGELPLKRKNQNITIESVRFENINFSYKEKIILDAFSMEMKKGDMIGISGLSGRGKTTIINLLLGFLNPESGVIYMNDRQVDADDRKNFRDRIAYIKQQHFLLHASILENIILQEGEYDKVKMDQILAITGIDKLIESLPLGLDTMITENGKNFSGGQRQRFIFARALYKDFDLLLLDEPFNELDETAELEMLEQLEAISKQGKIVLLITHNKTALLYCNRKIDMDERG